MIFRDLMIALQAVFVVVANLQALPIHGTSQAENLDAPLTIPQETAFLPVLHFKGDVASVLPPGRFSHTGAIMRGKRFEWLGETDNQVTGEEREVATLYVPDIDGLGF